VTQLSLNFPACPCGYHRSMFGHRAWERAQVNQRRWLEQRQAEKLQSRPTPLECLQALADFYFGGE